MLEKLDLTNPDDFYKTETYVVKVDFFTDSQWSVTTQRQTVTGTLPYTPVKYCINVYQVATDPSPRCGPPNET